MAASDYLSKPVVPKRICSATIYTMNCPNTKSRHVGVAWYAHSKKMTFADAYKHLLVYKGIRFLEENYAYEQTLPHLDKVCNRNLEKVRKAI